MKPIAIYARVSTKDGRQHLDNQLLELQRYTGTQQWKIFEVYVDEDSGAKGPEGRPGLAALLADASRRKFDLVLVWSLDRFSRQGTVRTLALIGKLRGYGVDFHSYNDPILRTNGPFGDALIGLIAAIAEFERSRLQERIHAGMDRARAKGVKFGRPTVRTESKVEAVKALRQQGLDLSQIASKTGVSKASVWRILNKLKETTDEPSSNAA